MHNQPGIDIPASGHYRLDPAATSIAFRTRLFGVKPLHGAMRADAGAIVVDPATSRASVTATVDAASFHTGKARRDDDVRSPRFLDADTYPRFTFRAGSLSHDGNTWTLAGELTVRNVSRPVTIAIISVETTAGGFRARAVTRIDRATFNLTRAKWMGGRYYDIELAVTAIRASPDCTNRVPRAGSLHRPA